MTLEGWRNTTISVMATEIGPVAEVILDDVVAAMGIQEDDMGVSKYIEFLRLLYEELPEEIDRRSMCGQLRSTILDRYGL